MKIDFEQLKKLIQVLEKSNLSELEVKQGEHKIRIRKDLASAEKISARADAERQPSESDRVVYVTSPFVGTFYRAAAPDAEPFVDVGDAIKSGTVLCIIEAMKLMNEIEAEVEGTITEILVENGKPVEYGDRLFKLTRPR